MPPPSPPQILVKENLIRDLFAVDPGAPPSELARAMRKAVEALEGSNRVEEGAAAKEEEEKTTSTLTPTTPAPTSTNKDQDLHRQRRQNRETRRERRASKPSRKEKQMSKSKKKTAPGEFPLRPVALEVFYLGWGFRGFTTQTSVSSDLEASISSSSPSGSREADDGTVEAQLFRALRRTGLVPCLSAASAAAAAPREKTANDECNDDDGDGDENEEEDDKDSTATATRRDPCTWKELGYARCGRTDAGVSGIGQIVSLMVRSRLRRFQKVEREKKNAKKEKNDDGDDGDGLFSSSSSSAPEDGEQEEGGGESDSEEIDYPSLLNKALPPEVRVTGWSPVSALATAAELRRNDGGAGLDYGDDSNADGQGEGEEGSLRSSPGEEAPQVFSARFSATAREYRYFFVEDCGPPSAGRGGLDLQAMREAASSLVGLHDFRNLCKPDFPAVTNFVRRIHSCEVEEWTGALDDPFNDSPSSPEKSSTPSSVLGSSPSASRFRGAVLRVRGAAFLLHQVRCIASLLLMTGRGHERPSAIAELLDVSRKPRRPHYSLAPPEPLLFCSCDFDPLLSRTMRRSALAIDQARLSVRELLREQVARVALLGAAAARLDDFALETDEKTKKKKTKTTKKGEPSRPFNPLFPEPPLPVTLTRKHVPLDKRGSDPPLEERAAARGFALTTGAAPRRPAAFLTSSSSSAK